MSHRALVAVDEPVLPRVCGVRWRNEQQGRRSRDTVTVRPLEQGTEIGGTYVIEGPISIGGMGAVHRARRLADGLEVAVKQPLD
jgi:hypothetical protein